MKYTGSGHGMKCLWGCIGATLVVWMLVAPGRSAAQSEHARWIGSPEWREEAPANRFTYFRKVVHLNTLPDDATLLFAADSNARLWINGHLVRRKVTRYHEEHITAEVVHAGPYLNLGDNTIVVLHHSWGPITTFQRSGSKRAGLYLSGTWFRSDTTWQVKTAPQYLRHEQQILGVQETPRIRYSQVVDARERFEGDIHAPAFRADEWRRAVAITDGPWPDAPRPVETPGQREYVVRPMGVLAAGRVERTVSDNPSGIAVSIREGTNQPETAATEAAKALVARQPLTLEGKAGETRYITVDFFRPVHGYPFLKVHEALGGTVIDFGYAEIPRSQYDGEEQVDPEAGWIDPTGVVGDRYADRYITRDGSQRVELPDERTARWLTLHVHFEETGSVEIEELGFIKSQYPVSWKGSFEAGDEHISQIVKLALLHAEVTMSDAYVDTPGREDGQWYEDARLRAKIAARWLGDTRLRELLIRTVAESQREDGRFHDFPPTNYPFVSTYDWTMQWAAILYDQYLWSGDKSLIQTYWAFLEQYWANVLSHVDDSGLWIADEVRADIRVGIHPEEGQSSGIVTPGIIERLQWSVEMAEAIGKTSKAQEWRERAEQMTAAFRAHHVVPGEGDIPAHVGDRYDPNDDTVERGFSQAAQTMAIYTDLLSEEQAADVLAYAFPPPDGTPPGDVTRWNNPTFSYRALRALAYTGLTERAVQHMIERYSQYLPDHPANPIPEGLHGPYGGPLPEYWISREDRNLSSGDVNTAQPVDDTGSHGWAAVPLLWLHDTLLGVRIEEPGGKRLRIAPLAGGLPFVQGYTSTPKGTVWVSWEPQQWKVEVQLPEDVEAEIVLPAAFEDRRVQVSGADMVEQREQHQYVARGGGRYVFQAY